MIEIALEKRQGAFHLDASFTVDDGITALFGRSGAGKTSVVAMTAGLARPDRGRIVVGETALFDSERGIDLPSRLRRIGMVFQDGRLFPHMTVRQNLRYGEMLVPAAERYAGFDKVVDLLGIGHLLERRPGRLSGGEKQRVAIGRALLASPRLLLMDEPLAALDGARKAELMPFIAKLSREFSVPILYVSHAIEEIVELADNLVVLEDGRIRATGGVEHVLSAIDLSSITGRQDAGSLLKATVIEHLPAHGLTRFAVRPGNTLLAPIVEAVIGTEMRVRIPAHEVVLALDRPNRVSVQNVLQATVVSVMPSGHTQVDVRLDLGDGKTLWTRVTTLAMQELDLHPGLSIFALIKAVSIGRGGMALTH